MAVTKPVSFKNKEQDLLDYVEGKDFSYYVKELIRKDMQNGKEPEVQKTDMLKAKKKRKRANK